MNNIDVYTKDILCMASSHFSLSGMTDKLDFLEGDKKGKPSSQDPKKAVNKKGWVDLKIGLMLLFCWASVDQSSEWPANTGFNSVTDRNGSVYVTSRVHPVANVMLMWFWAHF